MSWGMSISGLASTLELFESVTAAWDDEGDQVMIVAPTVNYAIYNELGTSKMEARPFMRPAAERVNNNKRMMLKKYGSAAPNAGPVEVLAIAVQNEAKKIASRKGVRDTGALIGSITYEQV